MELGAKLIRFVERAHAIRAAYDADMDVLRHDIASTDLDPAAVARLVSWLAKDAADRAERDAVDEQYRFLVGALPAPAELPADGQIAKAAALYADGLTIRAVAKEMGVSVGKAHKLKTLAAAFNVHVGVNVNTPHDPETGEITEATEEDSLGDDAGHRSEPSRPAEQSVNAAPPPGPSALTDMTAKGDTPAPILIADAVAADDGLDIPQFLRRAAR